MKIFNRELREEGEVYAISIATNKTTGRQHISFFYTTEGSNGLANDGIENIDILTDDFSKKFKFKYDASRNLVVLMWDYFEDMNHVRRVVEMEEGAIGEFEDAVNAHRIKAP